MKNGIQAGITEITQNIWRTVLDLPLDTAEEPEPGGEPSVTCFVQVEGAWEGAVVLRCSTALAGVLAGAMFHDDSAPDPADVSDAMGELTNILAGNIKALLPQPCRIALPVVALGRDYQVQMLRTRPLAEVAFGCRGDMFVVTLLEQSDSR